MDYYAVLPISNLSTKPIVIYDSNQCDVGHVRRTYTSTWHKILQQIPITDDLAKKVHMDGEDEQTTIQIREHSFKKNLTRLK